MFRILALEKLLATGHFLLKYTEVCYLEVTEGTYLHRLIAVDDMYGERQNDYDSTLMYHDVNDIIMSCIGPMSRDLAPARNQLS